MREHVLNEIRRLAAENGGRTPGSTVFSRETGIRDHEWRGIYWARWSDALIEAGFEPNEMQGKLDSAFVLGKLAEAARYYGKMPTRAELKMYRKVDQTTFYRIGRSDELERRVKEIRVTLPEAQEIR